eukprot:8955718-Lingulodinium_polyedra.AAC.1
MPAWGHKSEHCGQIAPFPVFCFYVVRFVGKAAIAASQEAQNAVKVEWEKSWGGGLALWPEGAVH